MTSPNDALISKLQGLVQRASSGDREAVKTLHTLRKSAESGDPQSKVAWAGVRYLYWRKRKDQRAWGLALALYKRAASGDAKAKQALRNLVAKAKSGSSDAAEAAQMVGMIKAIHGQHQPGAIFPEGPGSARYGSFGLPSVNTAGIAFGGEPLTPEQIDELKYLMMAALGLGGDADMTAAMTEASASASPGGAADPDQFVAPSINMIRARQALEGKKAGQPIAKMASAKPQPQTLQQKFQSSLQQTASAKTVSRAASWFQ